MTRLGYMHGLRWSPIVLMSSLVPVILSQVVSWLLLLWLAVQINYSDAVGAEGQWEQSEQREGRYKVGEVAGAAKVTIRTLDFILRKSTECKSDIIAHLATRCVVHEPASPGSLLGMQAPFAVMGILRDQQAKVNWMKAQGLPNLQLPQPCLPAASTIRQDKLADHF